MSEKETSLAANVLQQELTQTCAVLERAEGFLFRILTKATRDTQFGSTDEPNTLGVIEELYYPHGASLRS
ncbi:MAG: hypothetical protein AAF943_16215 [Pseudomonadota bacterium]